MYLFIFFFCLQLEEQTERERTKVDISACTRRDLFYEATKKDFHLNVTDLQAYTTYSINVLAVTRCRGISSTNDSRTDEDS